MYQVGLLHDPKRSSKFVRDFSTVHRDWSLTLSAEVFGNEIARDPSACGNPGLPAVCLGPGISRLPNSFGCLSRPIFRPSHRCVY